MCNPPWFFDNEVRALASGSSRDRADAARRLFTAGSAAVAAVPFLVARLMCEDFPHARLAIVHAIAKLGEPTARDLVPALVADFHPCTPNEGYRNPAGAKKMRVWVISKLAAVRKGEQPFLTEAILLGVRIKIPMPRSLWHRGPRTSPLRRRSWAPRSPSAQVGSSPARSLSAETDSN